MHYPLLYAYHFPLFLPGYMLAFNPTMNGYVFRPVGVVWNADVITVIYPFGASDSMSYLVDIINYKPRNPSFYGFTIFKYMPGMPSKFTALEPVWLDWEASCADASQSTGYVSRLFNCIGDDQFTVPTSGSIMQMASDLDDGGVAIEFLLNNNTNVCNSTTTYETTAAFYDPIGDLEKKHISNMTSCFNAGNVNKGDMLNMCALYNTMMYPPMVYPTNQSQATPIIGIGLAYLADTTTSTQPSTTPKMTSGAVAMGARVGLAAALAVAAFATRYFIPYYCLLRPPWGIPYFLSIICIV